MSTFFIVLLTLFLLGICGFTILLILMQRPSEESGMGATLGGGAVTSVFGGEAVNTLAKMTRFCVIIFFVLSFVLALFHMALEQTIKARDLLEKKVVPTAGVVKTDGEFIIPEEQAEEVIVDDQLNHGVLPLPEKESTIFNEKEQQESGSGSADLVDEENNGDIEDVNVADEEI